MDLKDKLKLFQRIRNDKHAETDLQLLKAKNPSYPFIPRFERDPKRYAYDIQYALLDVASEEEITKSRTPKKTSTPKETSGKTPTNKKTSSKTSTKPKSKEKEETTGDGSSKTLTDSSTVTTENTTATTKEETDSSTTESEPSKKK